jgi:uncharacterized repeat protein (TIGR03806 family)
MKFKYLILSVLMISIWACKKDKPDDDVITPPPPSQPGVVLNLNEVPYTNLSQYQFFTGDLKELEPNNGVLPYDVITPLFSDYASKKRFVWMPTGTNATYAGADKALNFPDGAALIKNFYYNNVQPTGETKILETRLMYRKNGFWQFANYVWNEAQTEAVLDLQGSNVPVSWIDEDQNIREVLYRIPNVLECQTCHKSSLVSIPIGVKPQNLNMTYDYVQGPSNQLMKWQQTGYLQGNIPANIETTVRWDDQTAVLSERVRAYLDMNCSHCHTAGGHCDYRPVKFAYSESADPVNQGVCVEPEENLGPSLTHIISVGNIEKSVLHFRLNTTDETKRMPLLGRTVIHEEAVQMIADYINSLTEPCQ